jgi:DNA-binding CsgD family transcriptional regulator
MADVPVLPPAASGAAPGLVGRAEELAALDAALAAAARGTAGGVLVEADAGVGKSRLVAELVAHARAAGGTVLLGHCASGGGEALPYLPFVEALDPLREQGFAPPFWSVTAPGESAADLSQLQLFDAVAAALVAAARVAPVLLVVEDLHWADAASRDLLTYLLRRVRGERLLVVATVRTDDLHRRHPLRPVVSELSRLPGVQRVLLDPFTGEETARFLRDLAGHDVPSATVRRIHGRSEGNAYYAAELLLAGSARGGRLPSGLADVVLTRLETLPPEVSDLVRTAAVGGRRVRHDLLAAVTGLPAAELEARLRDAVASRVLEPDGEEGYSFRHALLHEALYDDLLPGERVRWHAAYAEAIAVHGLAPAARLAHHARQSNDLPRALVAGLAAADEAERLRAPGQAWRHLEEALPLWRSVPDAQERTGTTLLAATVRASRLAAAAGEVARSALTALDAVDLLPPEAAPDLAAEVHQQCASALWACDRFEEGIAQARLAVTRGGDDPRARHAVAWAAAVAARCHLGLDRFEEAAEEGRRALELARADDLASAEADALITLAGLDNLAGRLADADALFTRAAATAEAGGHLGTALRARYNLAADRYDRGDLTGAAHVLDSACAWAAGVGLAWSPYGLTLLSLQARTSFVTGEFDRALAQARALGPQAPHLAAIAVGVVAAEVLAARGAFAEAEAVLEPEWFDDVEEGLPAAVARAETLRWNGSPAAAADVLLDALDSFPGIEHPQHLLGLRIGAQAVGALADAGSREDGGAAVRVERAETRVAELLALGQPRAGTLGPEGRAWVAVLRAESGRFRADPPAAQVSAWEEVVTAFSYGNVHEQARARWRLAEARVAAGQRDEGLADLRAARRTADRLGAVPLSRALGDLARRARAVAGPGRGPLTARELQVLDLLAAGRTNRQVGEALFMAEKTASVHVSRIFAKLGASSRAEAVSIGLRSGILTGRDRDDE